ncbi:MAG: DUF1232 domain-containing protein [Oscillospiraceae bacterium]|jgi:uncharacterized membrane protein YkvA (DUF1232 family)|nr:DUF1232 domain-containing protein [Oscillospiraceae bacterium]
MNRKLSERVKQVQFSLPALFLAIRKKETPFSAKLFAGITVGYALSPIDLIPDFIPVLGYLDDFIILPALISITLTLIPKEIMTQCRKESENLWKNSKPKKWYFALPIAGIWLLAIFLIVRAFL